MTGFFEGATRADALRKKTPDHVADLWLYPIEQGGRKLPGGLGWGCPFSIFPSTLKSNAECGVCTECFKTCPHDNMTLAWRRALLLLTP